MSTEDETEAMSEANSDLAVNEQPAEQLEPVPDDRSVVAATGEAMVEPADCECGQQIVPAGSSSQRIGDWMHRRRPRQCAEKPRDGKTSNRSIGLDQRFIDADGKYVREAHTFRGTSVIKHVVHCPTHGYRLMNLGDLGVEMCENCRILDGSQQKLPLPNRVPFVKMGDYREAIFKSDPPPRSPIEFEQWAEDYVRTLLRHTEGADNPLGAAIALVVGTASMCWIEHRRPGVMQPTRVFDDAQANRLVQILQAWIELNAKNGTILGEDMRPHLSDAKPGPDEAPVGEFNFRTRRHTSSDRSQATDDDAPQGD